MLFSDVGGRSDDIPILFLPAIIDFFPKAPERGAGAFAELERIPLENELFQILGKQIKPDGMRHHVDFICFKTEQSWPKIFKRETIVLRQDKRQ